MEVFTAMEENRNYYHQLRFYEQGGVVFYEGEYGDCLYDIQQGRVGVYLNYNSADRKLVAELGAGDYFGEAAIIEVCPRNATIVALESNTIIQLIRAADFPTYAEANIKKVIKMMMGMGKKAQTYMKKYNEACGVLNEIVKAREGRRTPAAEIMEKAKELAGDFNPQS